MVTALEETVPELLKVWVDPSGDRYNPADWGEATVNGQYISFHPSSLLPKPFVVEAVAFDLKTIKDDSPRAHLIE